MTSTVLRNRFRDEYRRSIQAIPNRDVEAIYIQRAKEGDRAATTRLIYKYIPFLYKMAKQLSTSAYNLTIDELVNSAVFGLPKAVKEFDSSRGTAFYTYFSAKALNEMKKASFASLLIHRPENILKSKDTTKASVAMLSTDMKVDGKRSISELLRSETSTEECTVDNENTQLTESFLSMVSDNEREVLNRLFVFGDDSVTLRSVGSDMNVSHERVRQIRNAALNRIRKSPQYENMVAEAKYLRKEAV